MRPTTFISSLLLFTAASTAWPWPQSWQHKDVYRRAIAEPVQRRQQSSFDQSFTGVQGNTATTKSTKTTNRQAAETSGSASASNTKNNNDNNNNDSKTTGKTTGKNTDDNNDKKTTSKYQTTKTFDNRLPAGGVSMITPAAIAGPQYYKIASKASQNYVTFAWNYTSLSMTPSRIDILASCSLNSATYTIAANATVTPGKDATQAVTWDTGEYQATATQPLVMATYTLIIMEADSEITAMPRAGYLGTWSQFTFGMYIPQAKVPMEKYVCATCSGAMSLNAHTSGFVFGMVVLTVLSFGWFGGVAGLW